MSGPQESDPYRHGAAPQAGPGQRDMRETQLGYGQPLFGASPDQSQQGHEAQAFFPPGGPVGQSYSPLGQFGPPGQQAERKGPWPVLLSVLAVVVVAAAAVGVVGFWKPGYFVTNKLDVMKAQSRIQEILTDETNGYGAKNVKDIVCNNGQNVTAKKGGTFTCDVSIDGTKYQLTATFQDNLGTYIVDRPK